MKKIYTVAVILTFVLVYACKLPKTTTASVTTTTTDSTATATIDSTAKAAIAPAPVNKDTITDLSLRKIIKDKELYTMTTDVIGIDSAYISNNDLHIFTKKTRACDAKNFKVMWNGMLTKSMPPQTNLKLFLMNDALCKESHYFHLTYNLTPMQFKPDSTTQQKTIVVKLGGAKHSMSYTF